MFVAGQANATVDHLFGWKTVFGTALGHETTLLVARRNGVVCGVLPLVLFRSRLFGRCAISLPFLNYGGVLALDTSAAAALLDEATARARAFGAAHVELRHMTRHFEGLPYRAHKVAMVLPLPASVEELWAQVDRKVRNQVRKAQKEKLDVAGGGAECLDEFYAVFARNMRDLGTPVYPRRLFEETFRQFPREARVFVVRHNGAPVAAAITLAWRQTILNPWASSLRQFRQLNPNVLLYWTMLEEGVRAGMRTFDFGRSSPDGGTFRFKEQWGARPTPMHWEYSMLSDREPPNQGPSNPTFALAIRLWQHLPLRAANMLGPAIARQLP